MGDWVSQLKQIADQMKLDADAKAKASAPTVAQKAENASKSPFADQRPASPRMPGYPTTANGKQAPRVAPHKRKDPLKQSPIRNDSQLVSPARDLNMPSKSEKAKFREHLSVQSASAAVSPANRKPAKSPTKQFLSHSSPPSTSIVAPSRSAPPPRDKNRSPKPLPAVSPTKMAPAPGKAQFSAPNMAEFTICHGSSDASTDQSWQEIGARLNTERTQNRGRAQCTLGIDFGTAFTKACVQFRQATFVVHWEGAVPNCTPFLLPSVFSELQNGHCVLGTTSNGCLHEDLKMGLLSYRRAESEVRATVFLALATRYIRAWLFSKHTSVFGGFQLEWFINVGLPAVPWDDSELRNTYKQIAFAGWQLGLTSEPITIRSASSVLSKIRDGADPQFKSREIERFGVFPEFVAQINSYRKSPQRRRDLHLLVDVGAGTVDVVTFHVWEPEDSDCYSILEAAVKQLGTHILLGYRAQAGQIERRRWEDSDARLSISQFELKCGLSAGKLKLAQGSFIHEFHLALEKVLRKTKAIRYETSPAWKAGVPFFFCGGGRTIDAYREAIAKSKQGWVLSEMQMPWPDGLQPGKLQKHDFHRVSVAHGLSYSADNIGQIERRSEVPDLRRSQMVTVDYSNRYIEK